MSATGQAKEPGCFPRTPMKSLLGSKRHGSFVEGTRLRIAGKVAVITGAASGIGAATARLFVSQGARVIIADVQAEAGRKLSSELGSSAHFFHCDVTKEADVAAAVDYAVDSWGHLDIMFNNAGVPGPLVGLADINMDEFDEVMGVHIKGAVLGVKHAARVMIPAGKGVILFSGSTSAKMGGAGPPLHSAANAAVLCIVRSAAAELVRHGIRVNAVSPHCVATPMSIDTFKASMNPEKDITIEQFEKILAANSELDVLTTEKVASAVLFLASDDAGFISGHNLVLDGGFSVTKQFDSSDLRVALQKSLAAEGKADAESKNEVKSLVRSREGSGTSKLSKASIAKEPKVREKEGKAAQKSLAEKAQEKQREVKNREERENERKIEEEKARAKQVKAQAKEDKARAKEGKALAKEGQAPAKDPPTTQTDEARDVHPLDKKASAKEERIQNENIEVPNAGPEPDIPLEYQSRPPVTRIGKLLSRRKDSKKEGKTEDKSADQGKVSKNEKKGDKPTDQGKISEKERGDDKSTEPIKVSKQEKQEGKSINPGKASRKEAKSPAKEEITPESQPKQRTSSLLSWRKHFKKEGKTEDKSADPGKVSKNENNDEKPTDQGRVSQKERKDAKSTDKGKASKKETKSPAKEEITPESQPKQFQAKSSIGSLLSWGKDSKRKSKTEDNSTDPGKVSRKEKKEDKSADPGKVSKQEKEEDKSADPGKISKQEKKERKSTDPGKVSKQEKKKGKSTGQGKVSKEESKSPAKEEITPESQPKQSPVKRVRRLLSWGKDSTNDDKTEDKSTNPGKVEKMKKKVINFAGLGKVSAEDSKKEGQSTDPAKASKKEPKSPAKEKITPESQPKQSPGKRVGSLLSRGKDSTKEGKTEDKSTGPGKVSKNEKKEAKSPAKEERARPKSKDSPKTPTSPEITPEPQQKQSPLSRVGSLSSWGVDPTKKTDQSADAGKVSRK